VKGQEGRRGQSLVEFAICLSVLILIFLGVFDLGRVFHTYIVITNAAREGAYYGAMHADDHAGIVTRVISEAQSSAVSLSAENVTISGSAVSGTPISVCVDFAFSLFSTFLLGVPTMQLSSCTQMVTY